MTGQPSRTVSTTTEAGSAQWLNSATCYGDEYPGWTPADVQLTDEQRQQLPAEIERASAELCPAGGDQRQIVVLQSALLGLGVRVQPGLEKNQARAWAASTVASLCHLPADLLTEAIRRACRTQFRFLGDVGPWLADELAEPVARRRRVLHRLEQLRRLPPPPVAGPPLTDEQIEAIYAEVGWHPRRGNTLARRAAEPKEPPRMPTAQELEQLKKETSNA